MPGRTVRSAAFCPPPPPPPQCLPETFNGTIYDTSIVVNNKQWFIQRVIGAATRTNEWALQTRGSAGILIRGNTPALAEYVTVNRPSATSIAASPLTISQSVYITAIADTVMSGDASVQQAVFTNGILSRQPLQSDSVNSFIHWDGHPTVSSNGKILVFASDRPGSLGGTDLWWSALINQAWSAPQPLGDGVNTPCDELCPQFAGDSVLLFSSAGHSTVGGYDLFAVPVSVNGSTVTIGKPYNLGKPVNTPFDEMFPVWADAQTLYYSSDQPVRGSTSRKDFDVFVLSMKTQGTRIEREEQVVTEDAEVNNQKPAEPAKTVVVAGTVIRNDTQEPVSGADVKATKPASEQVISQTQTDTAGRYALNLPEGETVNITAQTPELFFDKIKITVPKVSNNDTVTISKPLSIPVTMVLRINFPTAIFDAPYQYTLDTNGVDTDVTWNAALQTLVNNIKLSGSRLKRLVLIGHTDDVGTDASNITLGRNRVNFIIQQLVASGVNPEILEGRTAGESLLPSRRPGESIVLWRKRARRVELVKVLEQ